MSNKNNNKSISIGQYFQQGDVIVRRVKELPEGLQQLSTKVLQESETTGHHHHFMPEADVAVFQSRSTESLESAFGTITPNLGKYITVGESGAVLFHGKEFEYNPAANGSGDHIAIELPPGIYEIDIVREYDYDTQEMVRVVD